MEKSESSLAAKLEVIVLPEPAKEAAELAVQTVVNVPTIPVYGAFHTGYPFWP